MVSQSGKLLPPGDDRIGMTPYGPIGTPDEMRPRLELWRRQQAALEAGEDPTLIEIDRDPGREQP